MKNSSVVLGDWWERTKHMLPVGTDNVPKSLTATSIRPEVFSPQEAAFFKEANALDYELYDFAQTLARQLTAQALQRLSTPTWDFIMGGFPERKCLILMFGMIHDRIFYLYVNVYSQLHIYLGIFRYLENSVLSISSKWSFTHQPQLCGLKRNQLGQFSRYRFFAKFCV